MVANREMWKERWEKLGEIFQKKGKEKHSSLALYYVTITVRKLK
jgi:hypothetical protein